MKKNIIIDHVLRQVDEILINKRSKKNIELVAHKMPELHSGGFECHLGQRDQDLDFVMRVDMEHDHMSLAHLGEHLTELGEPPTYVEKLQDASQVFSSRKIDNFWLEFDTSESKFNQVPSIFFDMPDIHRRYMEDPFRDIGVWENWLKHAFNSINLKDVKWKNVKAIGQCIKQLPETAFLHNMGVMTGRKHELKPCFRIHEPSEIIPFLTAVGVKLTRKCISELESVFEMIDYATVTLGIEDGKIAKKFGVEVFISRDQKTKKLWEKLLAHLKSKKMCTTKEASGILSWHQDNTKDVKIKVDGESYQGEYYRSINHVKLVCGGSKVEEAKAYLYYAYEMN